MCCLDYQTAHKQHATRYKLCPNRGATLNFEPGIPARFLYYILNNRFPMQSFFDRILWGNTLMSYLLVLGGIALTWVVLRLIKNYILSAIKQLTGRTQAKHDDILLTISEKFIMPWLFLFVNFHFIRQLELSARADRILTGAMAFITMFFAVRLINHAIRLSINRFLRHRGESMERIGQLNGMLIVVSAAIWIIGLLTLANNFGYNISTILASLGVGGIAIALASQAILGDLFSYLVIFFDKPFEIGDFVVLNDKMGSIEYIGIKSTRIRSLGGEQLILSNTSMTSSVIHNYKRMDKRRVVFRIAVLYETDYQRLNSITGIIRDIILAQKDIQPDRVHLADYGSAGINFEAVYYMLTADYNRYMDTQQAILLAIHESFGRNGIKFASPVQYFYIGPQGSPGAYANGDINTMVKAGNNASGS